MKKINRLILKFFGSIFFLLKSAILSTFYEICVILRNRKYAKNYPVMFSAFAIIEHEQSSHVFEVNGYDFLTIKNNIFAKEKITNSHILEALRGLFQNPNPIFGRNAAKIKIADYFFIKTKSLINSGDAFYEPLIKAFFHGFPFLLNYNNYELSKLLIAKRSRLSLRLLKHVLNHQEFFNFFLDEDDIFKLIRESLRQDNKLSFMLLMKYLRQNDLLDLFFQTQNYRTTTKILSANYGKQHGFEYAAILASYVSDNFLKYKKIKHDLVKFLTDIFSHHLHLKNSQKIAIYHLFESKIAMNQRMQCQNSQIEKILTEIVERFVEKYNVQSPKNQKNLAKYIKKSKKPSPSVGIRGFFALSAQFPEEYYLLRNAPFLL